MKISLPVGLFLLFLGLKLGGIIEWSWWWVTSPLWIPFGIVLAVWAVFVILFLLAFMFGKKKFKEMDP